MKRNAILFLLLGIVLQSCKVYEIRINPFVKQTEGVYDSVFVEIPRLYELLKITQTLTGVYQETPKYLDKNSGYYKEVMEYYRKYQDHELVKKLNKNIGRFHNYPEKLIRLQSSVFEIDEDGRIKQNKDYEIKGFGKSLPLPLFFISRNKQLIEDFYQETRSHNFLDQHQEYYDSLTNLYHNLCDFRGMWIWLEKQFPYHYNSYRISFSPLTGGFHNTTIISDDRNDFTQILMFVGAPEQWENISRAENSAIHSRSVFTEIDHNYVNPVSSEYIREIRESMGDYKKWNTGKQRYPNAYLTFNEYMTWSVFCLYASDTYEEQYMEKILERVEQSMCDNRGFIKFKEFNRELLRLYQNKSTDEQVSDLYPAIIEWMEKN